MCVRCLYEWSCDSRGSSSHGNRQNSPLPSSIIRSRGYSSSIRIQRETIATTKPNQPRVWFQLWLGFLLRAHGDKSLPVDLEWFITEKCQLWRASLSLRSSFGRVKWLTPALGNPPVFVGGLNSMSPPTRGNQFSKGNFIVFQLVKSFPQTRRNFSFEIPLRQSISLDRKSNHTCHWSLISGKLFIASRNLLNESE